MNNKKQLTEKIIEEIEDVHLEYFRFLEALDDELQENSINKLQSAVNRLQIIVHGSKESLNDSILALGFRLNTVLAKLKRDLLNALDD